MWIIVMFLSAVWTLILTAPIHCRGSIFLVLPFLHIKMHIKIFLPSLCLLNDDSGLCISSMQKRMLFAGLTAVKKTIIQNWFTPHMCREAYWIRSLLQIVSCECTTARVGGARPSTIEAWQCFLLNIRDYVKE